MEAITEKSQYQIVPNPVILAIDGSGITASVALLSGNTLLGEYTTNYKKTHSETLLPMVEALLEQCDFSMDAVDAIAVAAGPGSFTGVRIASSTAKGLGFVHNLPIISVPTVNALAYNLSTSSLLVCPIMDARREQVYSGLYAFENGKMQILKEQDALAFAEICQEINKINRPVVFLGDGVKVFEKDMPQLLTVSYQIAPANLLLQRASSVGLLGFEMYKAGEFDLSADHRPIYLRQSQAEREREEKMGGTHA